MQKENWKRQLAAGLLSLLLAACGGGDEEESSSPSARHDSSGSGGLCPQAGFGILLIVAFNRWDLCGGNAVPISPIPGEDPPPPPPYNPSPPNNPLPLLRALSLC